MASITTYFNTGRRCNSGWTAPPYWSANTTYHSGDVWTAGVKPSSANGHHYLCTADGTSGSDDPFDNDQSDKNWDVVSDGSMQWTCFDHFTNPTPITGEPFGHGFTGSLWYGRSHCDGDEYFLDDIDSTYLSGHTYNTNSLSSQHEVASIRYRIFGEGDLTPGNTYTVKEIWKKAGNIIFYNEYEIVWGNWAWYQKGGFIGWTPCWWWAFGSKYNENNGYEEITENGSDYLVQVKLYDGGGSFVCASNDADNTFTIENLQHTELHWTHIQDYTGAEVGGDFGMQATQYNVHDLGSDTYITAWYRQKNLTNSALIYVDGMDLDIHLHAYRSGYYKTNICSVTDKTIQLCNFTDTDYLRASIEGTVQDGDDQPIENANVYGNDGTKFYGAKTAIDGKYALPLHTAGTYQIHATKNNHDIVTHPDAVTQTGKHAENVVRNFTGVYRVERETNYSQGTYAHIDSLAVDGQSVIVPDDPVTGDGDLIIT